jgi:hypothetical protein
MSTATGQTLSGSTGRKHRQYTQSFNDIRGMLFQLGGAAGQTLTRLQMLDDQQGMLYSAVVKIADHLGIDLTNEIETSIDEEDLQQALDFVDDEIIESNSVEKQDGSITASDSSEQPVPETSTATEDISSA